MSRQVVLTQAEAASSRCSFEPGVLENFTLASAFNKMIETEQNADLPIPFEDYQELVKLLEVMDSDEILYFMPYNFKIN